MTNQEGFNCEFVQVLEEALESKCPICKKVLREPYQANCCGKSYCRQCIERHKSNHQSCLECGSKDFTLFHNKGLQKTMYRLCVHCTYKNEGCDWTGELKELDNHLNVHPRAKEILNGCQFVVINCPMSYTGCQVTALRKDMKAHLTESETALKHQLYAADMQRDTQETIEQMKQQQQRDSEEKERMKIVINEQEGDIQYKHQQYTELELRVKVLEKNYEVLEERYQLATRVGMAIKPVRFTMNNFMQYKQTNENWFSPPFYTHHQGYTVCLCIVANGEGSLYGEYTSVLLHMMKGDFDDYLKWPFRGTISVQLLDQQNEEQHHMKKLEFTDRTPDEVANRVTKGMRAKFGWGLFQFIEHDKLEPCYLKNDQLRFQIGQIELQ